MKKSWKIIKDDIIKILSRNKAARNMNLVGAFVVREEIKKYDFKSLLGFNCEAREVRLHLIQEKDTYCGSGTVREYMDAAVILLMRSGFCPSERDHVIYLSESRIWGD